MAYINNDAPADAFDDGVEHTIQLLAKVLGVTDWVPADGSEDYDSDVQQTLMNILMAKGLYSDETGAWAKIVSPNSIKKAGQP